MKRRAFLGVAAAALPGLATVPVDVKSIKSRGVKKVDIVYKSPHRSPNGLQASKDGLWVVDVATERGLNYVSLVNFGDGKVIREFQVTGLNDPSGMTVDGDEAMWINSTHNGLIFKCSSKDGTIAAKYASPGTGGIYKLKGDPAAARSPLSPAYPPSERPANAGRKGGQGRGGQGQSLSPGQVPLTATAAPAGEGGQGMEYRDGLLYIAILPTRRLYVLDPKTWVVQTMWQLADNRAHGVGWEDDTLWVA